MHFDKVLNNKRPVDRSVLHLLEQKPCMLVINNPISSTEVKRAINKLKKGKHQHQASMGSVAAKFEVTAYSKLAPPKISNLCIFEYTYVYSNIHGHFVDDY
jgi:hypothetical protein